MAQTRASMQIQDSTAGTSLADTHTHHTTHAGFARAPQLTGDNAVCAECTRGTSSSN